MEITIKDSLKLIEESKEYEKFKQEHPNAEICAGFFIIDFFGNDNKRSIDYKCDSDIFTCSLRDDDSIKVEQDKLIELKDVKLPELKTVNPDIKIDLDEVSSIARIKTLDEGISAKFSKIIAVLQRYDHQGKDMQVWNLTCMLEGLIIIHMLIDAQTGDIIKFERKSFMDMVKKK